MVLLNKGQLEEPHFSGSYPAEDVHFLLKPVALELTPVGEKERLIQSGERHYSEMLSPEQIPDNRYLALFEEALARNGSRLRKDIGALARQITDRPDTSRSCVVVSLARAGTPIGVLLARALRRAGVETFHYSISVIRGRGIDLNAMRYILARHEGRHVVFVDGWTGKGAITRELTSSLAEAKIAIEPFLVVVADPAGTAHLAATTEDYVIPSGLLNGIVSGLVSRSILNDAIVAADDFHACVYLQQFASRDLSRQFIEAIERAPDVERAGSEWSCSAARRSRAACQAILTEIAASDRIDDVNRIKPGIAEATRAILRRVPDKVYLADASDPEVAHMIYLARSANVPVVERDLGNYRAVTIIAKVGVEQE